MLPHDFNEAMGVGVAGQARRIRRHGGPTLDPLVGADDVSKPLRAKLLAVPALRAAVSAAMSSEIAGKWLDWNSSRAAGRSNIRR